MKFDYIVTNPAFNIAVENNIAGTGGNTTLYQTATRRAFNLLKPNGIMVNITLKGIISDLTQGWFKDYQIHLINLMSDLDVWSYNTCYFIAQNTPKFETPKFEGGLVSKIFTANEAERFPFVYYSGSNKKMKGFTPTGQYRVIRRLPSRDNDGFIYDRTDLATAAGWKFAFNVMESQKSYSITDEPIRGGTICYIPLTSREECEKLKLFVLNNPVYAEYIKRSKIKYHAFGLRHIKRFDLNQIETGEEIPREWMIDDNDYRPPLFLHNENVIDMEKLKELGQVFTPSALVEKTLDDLLRFSPDAFSDAATFCDNMCGNGRFLTAVLKRKLECGQSRCDALKTIFGVDIDPDVVEECRSELAGDCVEAKKIVAENIVCADAFHYDYCFETDPFFTFA